MMQNIVTTRYIRTGIHAYTRAYIYIITYMHTTTHTHTHTHTHTAPYIIPHTEPGNPQVNVSCVFQDSCEWDIIDIVAERKLLPPGDPKPIAVMSFTLLLRRKRVFSSYILTLPCIILAVLTLVVFWLPADRPDRTSLGKSVQLWTLYFSYYLTHVLVMFVYLCVFGLVYYLKFCSVTRMFAHL